MVKSKSTWNMISWFIGLIFIFLGLMNLIYIHPVPGLIYLALSPFYIQPVNAVIEKKAGLTIPVVPKMILPCLFYGIPWP